MSMNMGCSHARKMTCGHCLRFAKRKKSSWLRGWIRKPHPAHKPQTNPNEPGPLVAASQDAMWASETTTTYIPPVFVAGVRPRAAGPFPRDPRQSACCPWLRSFCPEPKPSFGVRRQTTERTPTTNWAENSRENLGLFFFRSSRYSYKLNGAQGRRGKHASRRGRAKQRNSERPEKQGEF